MANFSGVHEESAFMTCIIRVDYETPKWQKAVRGVLRSTSGVRSFKMDESGLVEVSGMVDPQHLIKKLGRGAQVCWFQFGQCSSNLFLPRQNNHYGYNYNVGDGRPFPFRDQELYGGGQCYPRCCYTENYHHGVSSYSSMATRRRDDPSWEDNVGCCSVM